MDRKSATEFHKEGLNMKPEQNEDWTGSIIVKGLLDIVKVTIEKTPIPYEDVGTFMKGVSDQLAASIKVMDEALLEALARRGDPAVFSHYVAINAAVSRLLGIDRVLAFRPDHTSITVLETDGASVRLVEKGAEASTQVL